VLKFFYGTQLYNKKQINIAKIQVRRSASWAIVKDLAGL
jgi:hypothetical protein